MRPAAIFELIHKEFIQLFRDKKNRPLLVIVPLLQLLIFGYVVNYDVKNVRIALCDQAKMKESRAVVDAFLGSKIFFVTYQGENCTRADELVITGKADLAFHIGPNFSEMILKGQSAPLQVIVDGTMSNMASLRIATVWSIIASTNRKLLKEFYGTEQSSIPIEGRLRTWYNPNLESQYFFVPGIVAFVIMLLSLLLTSMAIIKERETGTLEQLLVTPLTPSELIIGKTVPYALIALLQMVGVTAFAVYWFELPLMGSLTILFLAVLIFLLSTLALGLFISTISATRQQAMMSTFFFILPFFMLSGFVFPIANMPFAVRLLTYLNPLRYMLTVIRGIFLKGVGLDALWGELTAMVVIGIALFTAAVKRFRKRLD